MHKFEIGEIAIFQPINLWRGKAGPGSECEIMTINATGPATGKLGCWCNFPGDPNVLEPEGWWFVVYEELRKKKPPEEQWSWEKIKKITKWDPDKVPRTDPCNPAFEEWL